jgi:predicted NACHT family NTPase
VIDWKAYLESICEKYAQWWDNYTITDVVSKNRDKNLAKSLLFDLQALTVKPETIKPERELLPEAREEKEILNVLEGLRKYAAEHVLLIGRPGSGKSTALVRSLLEESQSYLTFCSLALPGNTDSEALPPDSHEAAVPIQMQYKIKL